MGRFSVANLSFVRELLNGRKIFAYVQIQVHQCSKVDFYFCCFVCLFRDLLSFLVRCCLLHLESTLPGVKDLFTCSRFPEACVSERQTSRIFWTVRNSRFPETRWGRTTSSFCTPFFPGPHLRVSRTPWAFTVTRRILSHRYDMTRDETTCACFHL